MTDIMLVGNPNCGKTTLFNALTGEHQQVGNWPGVTVEKRVGSFTLEGTKREVIDLPGVYSLVSSLDGVSQDEQIAAKAVAFEHADMIINVIDACHLERHLYLTSQLLELGKPLIIALNMTDLALQRGICIDVNALSQALNCKVVTLQAHKSIGLTELHQAIVSKCSPIQPLELSLAKPMEQALLKVEKALLIHGFLPEETAYLSKRCLEGDTLLFAPQVLTSVLKDIPPDMDIGMADARYKVIHQIALKVQTKNSDASEYLTARIDRVVLHRFWALPIFFAMIYLMFLFAVNIGGGLQTFFDNSTDLIFVQGTAWVLQELHFPTWLIGLLAEGVGRGLNTTLTFIPIIACMFFALALLETSGYMARAAFVVDKVMRMLGLPGKSFVPMIVGFGCNVPAILAARTLDSSQDRLLTVMMSPFMSCSARLTIYALFVTAFFPTGGQNIVFSLYLIGILMAVLTGFLLRKTMLHGKASPLILELPAYHIPSPGLLIKETMLRLRLFIWRAGKFIIPVCILLRLLTQVTIEGESILSFLGQCLTPLFSPMGIRPENWPATVGLLSGMLSKEVVVGTLNTLYTEVGHGQVATDVFGVMSRYFDGPVGAYAYLIFILLYIPCVSTMAAIKQEASNKLMWFSIVWSCIVAYAAAVLFYQLATFLRHPQQTIFWVLGMVAFICSTVMIIRLAMKSVGRRHVIANS